MERFGRNIQTSYDHVAAEYASRRVYVSVVRI